MFVVGLAVTSTLVARKVQGGLLIGILATTVFAIIVNQGFGNSAVFDTGIAVIPDKIVVDAGLLAAGELQLRRLRRAGVRDRDARRSSP